jgi:hypothetical protein
MEDLFIIGEFLNNPWNPDSLVIMSLIV